MYKAFSIKKKLRQSVSARFISKISLDEETKCWNWTGYT